MPDTPSLGCVNCHMPLVEDGEVRSVPQHLRRGEHDPESTLPLFEASSVFAHIGGKDSLKRRRFDAELGECRLRPADDIIRLEQLYLVTSKWRLGKDL